MQSKCTQTPETIGFCTEIYYDYDKNILNTKKKTVSKPYIDGRSECVHNNTLHRTCDMKIKNISQTKCNIYLAMDNTDDFMYQKNKNTKTNKHTKQLHNICNVTLETK